MCVLLMLAAPSLALAALKVPGPEQLPADTWVLLNWHGVDNATRVRKTNPVMQLWDDPQFAAAREQIASKIAGSLQANASPEVARAAMDDVLAVLENPLVIGVAGDPMAPGRGTVHLYGVLNRKGKQAEWSRLQSADKARANAQISTFMFRDVQVTKTVTTKKPKTAAAPDSSVPTGPPPAPKVTTAFEAVLGDYELFADDRTVMEALITRLQDGRRPDDSLLKNAAYQRAQRFRARDALLEVFVKVPDLSRARVPATPQMNMSLVLRELHLDHVQGLWLSAGMERRRMTVRAALLGDTSPGSVLDMIGGNVRDFQTLALAPADASFAAWRIDLPALYAVVSNAYKMGMSGNQGVAISAMLDSMVMARTGLRITELLSLFDGELGMVTNSGDAAASTSFPAMLMMPVKGDQVLAVMRKVAGPLLANAQQVAGATMVQIGPVQMPAGSAAQGGQEAPGQPLGPFFLSVSSDMLMFGPDRAQIEAALRRGATHASAPEGSLAADKQFRAVRRSFPRELNGISYTDYSRVSWDRYVQRLHDQLAGQQQEMKDRADKAEKGDDKTPPNPQLAAQLRKSAEQLGTFVAAFTDLLPLAGKHLKMSAGASWKASDGVFFDSFVD